MLINYPILVIRKNSTWGELYALVKLENDAFFFLMAFLSNVILVASRFALEIRLQVILV